MPAHEQDDDERLHDRLRDKQGWFPQPAAVGQIRSIPQEYSTLTGAAMGSLPQELWVQLQDNDGRAMFDEDGRPVMVLHNRHRSRTSTRALYAILGIIVTLLVIYGVLGIIALVELHHLTSPAVDSNPFGP